MINTSLGLQIDILKKFGLSKEESEVYLHLLSHGKKTASEIRKDWKTGHTKVNTTLTQLKSKSLVYEIRNDAGRYLAATNPQILGTLLDQEKEKVHETKKQFEQHYESLLDLAYTSKGQSKVLNFIGIEGLKQVMWNSAQTKDALRLIELPAMSQYLDFGFYEKIREQYTKNKINSFEITNEKVMENWTNINKYVELWEARYIDPTILEIKFETMIYNNVVAIYSNTNNEIFCVEIHNEKLAQMQKQLFDFIWKRSQKMKLIDKNHGKTVLE
jgi:sugar-specific transcriptional regulator TrmB